MVRPFLSTNTCHMEDIYLAQVEAICCPFAINCLRMVVDLYEAQDMR